MNLLVVLSIFSTFTVILGVKESEMNEYVVIGLGLGVISIVMIAVFLLCHRKRKRRRLEHPSKNKMNINAIFEQVLILYQTKLECYLYHFFI